MHEICETLATAERQVSPTRFHNSVHNAPAGYWSIATQSRAALHQPVRLRLELCRRPARGGRPGRDRAGSRAAGVLRSALPGADAHVRAPSTACSGLRCCLPASRSERASARLDIEVADRTHPAHALHRPAARAAAHSQSHRPRAAAARRARRRRRRAGDAGIRCAAELAGARVPLRASVLPSGSRAEPQRPAEKTFCSRRCAQRDTAASRVAESHERRAGRLIGSFSGVLRLRLRFRSCKEKRRASPAFSGMQQRSAREGQPGADRAGTQRLDALVERRMRHEQALASPQPSAPEMPKALTVSGSVDGSWASFRRCSAAIIFSRPASCAPPASARNSRWRLNHITMMLARMPRTSSATIEVIQNAGPVAVLGLEHDLVDDVADDAREEDDEGVDHALDQRQRDHVAVGDVGDLVAQHRFGLVPAHAC